MCDLAGIDVVDAAAVPSLFTLAGNVLAARPPGSLGVRRAGRAPFSPVWQVRANI